MNKLKQITTKAKQLYKTGKFSKWTDAIKAAAASLPGAKKKAKKIKQYSVTRSADGTFKKGGVKRISGVKTKAATRNYGSHKDTASHNVKISVMSGHLEASKEKHLRMLKDYFAKVYAESFTAVGKEKKEFKKVLMLLKKDITKLK